MRSISSIALLLACAGVFSVGLWSAAGGITHGPWQRLAAHTAFEPRDDAGTFFFDGRYWLSNGYPERGPTYRDLWSSVDGVNWREEVAATPYDAYAGVAVFRGAIYAVKNSVWKSTNGTDWRKIANGPLTNPDAIPKMFVFHDRLWLFNGSLVYSSADAIYWRKEPEPAYGNRISLGMAVFDDALWMFAGRETEANTPPEKQYPDSTTYNDVWRSSDGQNWVRVLERAPWGPRMWPGAVAHGAYLYLHGGFDNRTSNNMNGTWRTRDGVRWQRVTDWRAPPPRHAQSMFSTPRGILMTGGNDWGLRNDVWLLQPPE